MRTRLHLAPAAAIVCCLIAGSAYAQDISNPGPAPAPANLAYIDGTVDVVLDNVTEAAKPPQLLIEGDVVRTRNGRAELVFGDGTLLHLAQDGELEILGNERVRLTIGRAIVRMSYAAARPYVIDTPGASIRFESEGEYNINAERSGLVQLSVARGSASLTDAQQWTIRGGQMITISGPGGRPRIESFNSARWDAFTTWSHDRATAAANAASAAQLPYELRPYGPVLDQYGRWDYVAPHGYAWFPSVDLTWRPYYDGSWSFTRYGWTWNGRDRWAWPTHHYGRWGFNGASWYWIPEKAWAPAWVTWSVVPGYVGWAPLGWHSDLHYDVWGRRDHPAYSPYYSPWRGWTVLPRDQFGRRRNVRAHAIDGDRLDNVTRRTLLTRATPTRPVEEVAVPRDSVVVPGRRGNVRRVPALPASRSAPVVPGAAAGRADDSPAYAPPPSWNSGAERRRANRPDGASGGTERGAATGRGTATERGAVTGRGAPSGAATGRRGADRDPATTRPAPGNSPRDDGRGAAPGAPRDQGRGAGAPQRTGESSGGAVPRSGAGRREGAGAAPARPAPAPGTQPQGGARRRPGG